MHKIVLTDKVLEMLEGTGVMQGDESPAMKAEMDSLKKTSRGASGLVSLPTLGWVLDTLEALGWSDEPGDAKAANAAIAKLDPIYRAAGGTTTTIGALKDLEAKEAMAAVEEPEHQEQSPAGGWTRGELRGLPQDADSRFLFGGKGGKHSVEPSQSTLAGVRYTEGGRYEIWDVATGAVLLTGALQSLIWWAPAPLVGGGATDRDPAEIRDVSAISYGRPVYHEHTGALVGYLSPDAFTPIGDV